MSEEEAAIRCVRAVVAADNGRDRDAYRALLKDEYKAEVHGRTAATSADEEAADLERYWGGFSDGRILEDAITASGGSVTLRYRLVGTNDGVMGGRPATGRKVEISGCTILEVEDGRVARTFRYVDSLGMMLQLGILPDPAAPPD